MHYSNEHNESLLFVCFIEEQSSYECRIYLQVLLLTSCNVYMFAGGESIYGGVFADEFHSRLRFKHRGLVACAGSGSPNTNGSQFFITLDRCDWLDKKHTIFGKVITSLYECQHWFLLADSSFTYIFFLVAGNRRLNI